MIVEAVVTADELARAVAAIGGRVARIVADSPEPATALKLRVLSPRSDDYARTLASIKIGVGRQPDGKAKL